MSEVVVLTKTEFEDVPQCVQIRKGHLCRYPFLIEINGDPTWTRTRDPMVKSHLLYRLSYRTTPAMLFCFQHQAETIILHIEVKVGKSGIAFF